MPHGEVPPDRKVRADAVRNRERILEAAKAAFTRHGANASLDDIARQAGVGSGTLYRHFPTRDRLIEAVYRADAERLAAAAHALCAIDPPVEAVRRWMQLFVDYLAAKQIIAPAFNSVAGGPEKLYQGSSELIYGAVSALLRRAVSAGELGKDVDPWDLLQPIIGVSLVPLGSDWPEKAKKLVDVLLRGSRLDKPET